MQVSPVPKKSKDSSFSILQNATEDASSQEDWNQPIKVEMTQGGTMRWGRTLLRFLQFALALVALATISRAFVGASYYGYSSMLGSSAATYTQLVTYTSMLVGLFLFLFVELLRYFKRPTPRIVEQLMDLVLAAMLVVAGIVLVVSDYVAHCSVYGYMLRCSLLKTAVVFSFLTAAAHLASFLLSSCEDYGSKRERTGSHSDYDSETGHGHPSAGYHAEATPTGASTPKGASNRV
ncbi:hypothetical protein PRNP1_002719 [Phytophthora ramorum]